MIYLHGDGERRAKETEMTLDRNRCPGTKKGNRDRELKGGWEYKVRFEFVS